MPAPTNTYTTFNLRGAAEDVDSKIYNLSPEETPFASSLASFKVDARIHQWQEDSFANANKDNAQVEGDDFSGAAQTPTLMLQNSIQTFTKDIVTSGLSDAIRKYGRSDEHDYLLRKNTIELRKDVEAALLSNNVGVAGNTTTASKMAGLELFSDVNVSHGATGATAAITNATLPVTAPTDGTTRPLTETIFKSMLATMWNAGAKPKIGYMTMTQKGSVDGFAGIGTRMVQVPPKDLASIVGSVSVYNFDSGPVAFVPLYTDRIRNRTVFITDDESIQRGTLRSIQRQKMGRTGDNNKTKLVTDVTLKVTNRRGVGKIADLS